MQKSFFEDLTIRTIEDANIPAMKMSHKMRVMPTREISSDEPPPIRIAS